VLRDAGAPLQAGSGCVAWPDGAVACETRGQIQAVVRLGDGDDRARGAAWVLDGGPGDDVLEPSGGRADGGDGRDRLLGRGSAALDGGADADVLEGLPDPGVHATPTVVYAGRTAPVRVTVDGIADDGEEGEGDDVRGSVTGIVGGAGADALTVRGPHRRGRGGPPGRHRPVRPARGR
jgi:hypothetical protein